MSAGTTKRTIMQIFGVGKRRLTQMKSKQTTDCLECVIYKLTTNRLPLKSSEIQTVAFFGHFLYFQSNLENKMNIFKQIKNQEFLKKNIFKSEKEKEH